MHRGSLPQLSGRRDSGPLPPPRQTPKRQLEHARPGRVSYDARAHEPSQAWVRPTRDELGVPDIFEGKDEKETWWPVVVDAPTGVPDMFRVRVRDSKQTVWQAAHRGNLRRVRLSQSLTQPQTQSPAPPPPRTRDRFSHSLPPASSAPCTETPATPRGGKVERLRRLPLSERTRLAEQASLRLEEDRLARKVASLQSRWPHVDDADVRNALDICGNDEEQAERYIRQLSDCVDFTTPAGDRVGFSREMGGEGAALTVNGKSRLIQGFVDIGPRSAKHQYGHLVCQTADGDLEVSLPVAVWDALQSVRAVLDRAGVGHSLDVEAAPEVLSATELPDEPSVVSSLGLRGMMNLGNTCYMNSALQCLLGTAALRQVFLTDLRGKDIRSRWGMKGELATEFRRVLNAATASREGSKEPTSMCVNPLRFKTVVGRWSPGFRGYESHDAHELLRFLLDGLHGDLQRMQGNPPYMELGDIDGEDETAAADRWWRYHKSREDSVVQDLFAGQLMSKAECMKCHTQHLAFDPILDLSVPMPGPMDGQASVEECMKLFTREEILDGDDRLKCRRCAVRQRTRRSLRLARAPGHLLVHLKRFKRVGGVHRKITGAITVHSRMDLRRFLSPPQRHPVNYCLYAVVHHFGDVDDGHYTATVRRGDGHWYNFNDSVVSRTADPSLQPSASAYLTFYRLEDGSVT
eukprot:TRINITY_DN14759_c0_g1_i1.p1 TRINITY_DN14759_c0_g1~~TRINITY_DN14759_c0_g1_i1.p1  ORF type:complete len:690 (+),score=158.15 TRINITY_DN14759_c0_g1_i1:66-2135(+)